MSEPATHTGGSRTMFKLCILFGLETRRVRIYESRDVYNAIIIENEGIGSFNVVILLLTISQHHIDLYNVVETHQSLSVWILNIS